VDEAQLERAAITLYERERSTCHLGGFVLVKRKGFCKVLTAYQWGEITPIKVGISI